MPIIFLATAAGAPGASTTALGLALSWDGPSLLVEADPAGSALVTGWFRGQIEPRPRCLLNLALARRGGAVNPDELQDEVFAQSVSLDESASEQRLALLGFSEPSQAPALTPWWEPLGDVLRAMSSTGYAVIIDGGRLTQGAYAMPLLSASDLVLLVTRGSRTSALRSYPMAQQLHQLMERQGASDALGVLTIHTDSDPDEYPSDDLAKGYGIGYSVALPFDPDGARVYSDGAPPRRSVINRIRDRRGNQAAAQDHDPATNALTAEARAQAVRDNSMALHRRFRHTAQDINQHVRRRRRKLMAADSSREEGKS